MTDVDHSYLPRFEQEQLVAILSTIPSLCEDLAVSLTRQDRIGTGMRIRSGSDEQPLPIGLTAMEAGDELHDELVRWVRQVCDQRTMPSPDRDDTISLARWLTRWMIALAMTEGAEEALHDIGLAVRNARDAVDRPREHIRNVSPADVLEASFAELSAQQIARVAGQLEDRYRNLNLKRVITLREADMIAPTRQLDGVDVYRLGDVLSAHLTYPSRRRKAA